MRRFLRNTSWGKSAGGLLLPNPIDAPGYVAGYDARQLVGSHLSAVSVWPEMTGNGLDIVQASAANQPVLLVTSDLSPGGKQLVRFSGERLPDEDVLQCSPFPNIPAGEASIYLIGLVSDNGNTGDDLWFYDGTYGVDFQNPGAAGLTGVGWWDGVPESTIDGQVLGWHTFTWVFGGGGGSVYVDGTLLHSGGWGGSQGSLQLDVGGQLGDDWSAKIDMGMFLVYHAQHSTAARQLVELYERVSFG